MTWKTHIAIGANAAWIGFLGGSQEWSLGFLVVGAFASLLPDLDAVGSGAKIHHIGGGALATFKGGFTHRGFMHSLLASVLLLCLCLVVLASINIYLPFIFALGYLSHPIIDGFNLSGVQYLFPLNKKFNLAPRLLCSPVKGWADQLLFVLGFLGVVMYIFTNLRLTT